MTNPTIQMIETASQVFLAPPHLVSPQQRHEAECIILDFRKIKCPYQLCKEILETSSTEYVLFETVGLLKNAVVKEWSELNDSDILSLRRYLLQYVLHHPLQLPSFVREKILQLMAIMVKRMSLEDAGSERRALIEEAQSLVSEGPQSPSAILGCSILQALLQEHAITIKSADIGLPWTQHFKLKKQFEATELRTIFTFTVKVLEELEAGGAGAGQLGISLLERLLLVAESALCWGHISPLVPKRLVGMFEAVYESDTPAVLRRSGAWRPILTSERLPIIFANLATRKGPLRRPALSCLGQLATLSGATLPEDAKGEHALRIARSLIPLLTTSPLAGPAAALRRLVLHFPRELLALPQSDLHHLLHAVATYITQLVELSALEEAGAGEEEEDGSRDALEAALEAWVGLLHSACPPLASRPTPMLPVLEEGSAHIFIALLRIRLAPPDGARCAGVEEDVEVEEEGSDLERCDTLLQLVGALGRAAPGHTLPLLCRLLEARTARMQELLQTREESKELCSIYEDLHWTLMFAGHVLTMEGDGDGDGETPLMPKELVNYSEQSPCDVQASLRLLDASTGHHPGDLQAADHIIRLVAGVWRMCLACGWTHSTWVSSPALAAGAAWLLRRWARSYLLTTERGGSPALQAAWGPRGADSTAGARLAAGARVLLLALPGEPDVAMRATQLLVTVASNRHEEADVSHCQQLWEAIAWGLGPTGAALPGLARRGLARAAALAVSPLPASERAARLAAVLQHARGVLGNAATEPAMVQAFDVYAGLADSAQSSSAECIWNEVRLALSVISRLTCSSGARVGGALLAGLRCASAIAARLPCLLDPLPASELLTGLAELLTLHAALPGPPPTASGDSAAEDDFCEEMMLVMEVTHGVAGAVWVQEGCAAVRAAATAGARAVLPRMVPPSPLLQRPPLAHQYYRLLQDLGSRNICALEDEYFNAAMVSIQEGMECGASRSGAGPACELLAELAARTPEESPRLAQALAPLAGRLLALAAEGSLQEVLRSASVALYGLLCALPHLRAQVPPGLAAHPFDGQRQNCLKFRDDFEKFIADVQNSSLGK